MIIDDNREEDIMVEEETTINAIITGNVIVKNNAVLQLYGTVTGDLVVEEGCKAYIFGSVGAKIINNGEIEVYGEVGDEVKDTSGKAFISRKAVIGKGE